MISTALLSTKLYLPAARSNLVPRPRLLERLTFGLQGALTLIAAPAGYGKTTLFREWRDKTSQNPVAWLSLEDNDNDLLRFLLYLTAAFDSVQAELTRATRSLLQSPQLPSVETICTSLLNELSVFPNELTLALDDYHVITNPEIHAILSFLLDHLPAQIHIVILTRADPPLQLPRLRARWQLTEIRSADLRFTVEEATAFLNGLMGLSLSPAEVAALDARTEGWIAGLQLAAFSMRGREDISGFISAFSGSHQYIVDYLVEEVLNRQTEPLRDFLLQTSIIDRLTASLCDAITGSKNSQAILESLAQSNLFVIPLDDERCWYRYHHLFMDLLRSRLQTNQPEQITELHRRAAAWYEHQDMEANAIEHSFAIHDYEGVRRILRESFPRWFRAENHARNIRWFKLFPQEFLYAEPWLCIAYAWLVWRQGKMEETEVLLNQAQPALDALIASGHFPSGDLEYEGLAAEILGFRALIATQKEDPARVIELANRALEIAPKNAATVRGVAYVPLQVAYREIGEMEKSIEACRLGLPEVRVGGEPGTIVSTLQMWGTTLVIQGRLHEAMQVYRNGLLYAESKGDADIPAYGLIRMRLADIYYQWNQLDEAEKLIRAGLVKSDFADNRWGMIFGRYLLCLVQCARGNSPEARNAFDEIEKILSEVVGAYYYEGARYLLLLARARFGLLESLDIHDFRPPEHLGSRPTFSQFERVLQQVRLQVATQRSEYPVEILSEMELIAAQRGNLYWLIQILILQALVCYRQGTVKQALGNLEQALDLAKPEGFIRIFLDEGPELLELLQIAGSNGIFTDYARQILSKTTHNDIAAVEAPHPELSPLSKRELELLGLIATGCTNKDIANQLYISIGTVKRHTVNIFTKLDVKNRTEAVAKARALGLL